MSRTCMNQMMGEESNRTIFQTPLQHVSFDLVKQRDPFHYEQIQQIQL